MPISHSSAHLIPLPSSDDVHITTAAFPRTALTDLPDCFLLTCTRAEGWALFECHVVEGPNIGTCEKRLIAGEYSGPGQGLRLDVGGIIIVDSLDPGRVPRRARRR
jgi:hypothetical protein